MTNYKGYIIIYNPKPIPTPECDYDFVHKDYDGEGDNRAGWGSSIENCKEQINEILAENAGHE